MATLYNIGNAEKLRPGSGYALVFSQQLDEAAADSDPAVAVQSAVKIYTFAGYSTASPPTPTEVANWCKAKGVAHVYYMEIWETVVGALGTGWDEFVYVAIGSS